MNAASEFTHKDLPVYSFKTDADFLNWLSKTTISQLVFGCTFTKRPAKYQALIILKQ